MLWENQIKCKHENGKEAVFFLFVYSIFVLACSCLPDLGDSIWVASKKIYGKI